MRMSKLSPQVITEARSPQLADANTDISATVNAKFRTWAPINNPATVSMDKQQLYVSAIAAPINV